MRPRDSLPNEHTARELILFAALVCVVLWAPAAVAGNWHYGASIVCSDCHTQHNSENGAPMRVDNQTDPAAILLRGATPQDVCLSCHDGSKPGIPNVLAPLGYVADAAGGFFMSRGGVSITPENSLGHHLMTPSAVIPPGGTQPMVLTCTTCHDPHGNDNYRNLRPDPTGTNQPAIVVTGTQAVQPNGSNAADVYATYDGGGAPNVKYRSGMSSWCMTCHGPVVVGSDHPVDKQMWGSTIADYARWVAVTLPRVPVHTASGVIPDQDNQVICLSCHKAHGSSNTQGLIYADGVTVDATCQECHNQ